MATIILTVHYGHGQSAVAAYVILWLVFLLSAAFTVVSVTEWCRDGAFLPSSILMLYFSFLGWVAFLFCPLNNTEVNYYDGENGRVIPRLHDLSGGKLACFILGVVLMILCLYIFVRNPDLLNLGDREAIAEEEAAENNNAVSADHYGEDAAAVSNPQNSATSGSDDDSPRGGGGRGGSRSKQRGRSSLPQMDSCKAATFLAVHTVSALYVRMLLLSTPSMFAFVVLVVTLFVNVALFGWAVIGPQFRQERDQYPGLV